MDTSIQPSNQDPAAALSAFNPIDRHFASFLGRLADNEPEVQLAAAVTDQGRRQLHFRVNVRHAAQERGEMPVNRVERGERGGLVLV